MVSHPETGSDSAIGSDQDRGCDNSYRRRTLWPIAQDSTAKLCLSLSIPQRDSKLSHQIILLSNEFLGHCKFSPRSLASTSLLFLFLFFFPTLPPWILSWLPTFIFSFTPFFFSFFFLPFFSFFGSPTHFRFHSFFKTFLSMF